MNSENLNLNKNINGMVWEAGAGVDAELGLQRSSTNPPLLVGSQKRKLRWQALRGTVAELRPWVGTNLKVSRVEILQMLLKATSWIPGKPEDPTVIQRRLEGFNPSLKTTSWRIVRHERPQEASATGGLKPPSSPDHWIGTLSSWQWVLSTRGSLLTSGLL